MLSQLPRTATVTSNIAPKHYGVDCTSQYLKSRDRNEPKVWDDWDKIWRCNIMVWYINIGDDLLRSRKIAWPFKVIFEGPLEDRKLVHKTELLECSAATQPVHPKKGIVTTNCTLEADLTSVPKHLFKRKMKSDGAEGYELHYKLMVSIQSGPMVFSLEVGGKEYGQVAAEY